MKHSDDHFWQKILVDQNSITLDKELHVDSYLAADLAELIRQQLLASDKNFTYETVMSHRSKIDFLHSALERSYKVYLYFIATEDPQININRVNVELP